MYTISFTNKNTSPIIVQDDTINQQTDVTLFGLSDTPYGQLLQENFLHLLEHFALPENPLSPGAPNTQEAIDTLLQTPISGELWYNKSNSTLYVFNGTNWVRLVRGDQVAANWGVIANGSQIPLPQTPLDGVPFQYSDCVWIVSPFNYPKNISNLTCSTDQNANVTVQYIYSSDSTNTIQSGYANYLILAIKGNQNYIPPTPTPSPTIALTPSTSPTIALTPSTTATPTVTQTVTPSVGTSLTPSISASSTPAPTVVAPSRTPTATPTITPSMTGTPYASPQPTPTVTPTPSSNFIQSVSAPASVDSSCSTPQNQCCATARSTATINGGIGPFSVSAVYISGVTASFGYQISGNSIAFTFTRCATSHISTGLTYTGYYELKVEDSNGGIAYSGQIEVQTTHILSSTIGV